MKHSSGQANVTGCRDRLVRQAGVGLSVRQAGIGQFSETG